MLIKISPKSPEGYYNLALAKYSIKDYNGCIQATNKSIELNPSYREAYFTRGNAKQYIGNKNGACLDFSKAGELGYIQAYDVIKEYCN
jgi:lipoprotein NlpI